MVARVFFLRSAFERDIAVMKLLPEVAVFREIGFSFGGEQTQVALNAPHHGDGPLSVGVGPRKCILKAFQDQYSNSFKNGVRAFGDGSWASPLPDHANVLQFEGFS